MTQILIENITRLEDLLLFSIAYQKGMIQLNLTKIAKHLKKDRKTVRKYLMGEVPTKTRKCQKYLDKHRDYIVDVKSNIKI